MSGLYFECKSGISGDMSVGALLDLGANPQKLKKALASINLDDEFRYVISKKPINSLMATDFDVIVKNNEAHCHHVHRNLEDINKIIDKADISEKACNLAKKIFKIVAQAEANVHGKNIEDVHFHEVGAIDSIVDIISFAVLFDDLAPDKVYFSPLTDGQGFVECAHGKIPVPVPAVLEIASQYKIPLNITQNDGEMVTPTGIAIVASLYSAQKLPDEIIVEKTGYGAGKRPYSNPILRVISISNN